MEGETVMKRTFLCICSVLLICACVLGLFAGVRTVQDVQNIKAYKNEAAATAREGIAKARDAIALLQENQSAYLEGAATYAAGLVTYQNGRATLQNGKATYAAGQAALADGKSTYATGRQTLAENQAAYEAGKALIGKIEPLMPYVQSYRQARHTLYDIEMGIPGISDLTGARYTLRAAVVNLAAQTSAVAWISQQLGMDLGSVLLTDYTDEQMISLADNIVSLYEKGLAQIQTYEQGKAKLDAAAETIAENEGKLRDARQQLAAAEAQLASGANTLADGKAKLTTFEDGQAQLTAGLELLLEEMTPCATRSGKQVVPGLTELLGADFSLWELEDDGSVRTVNGCALLDLDSCLRVCDEGEHYLDLQTADIKGEVIPRIVLAALMALAAVAGLIAGVFGLLAGIRARGRTGFVPGVSCAALAAAGNITGAITGYTDYAYAVQTVTDGVESCTYSGDLQFWVLLALGIVSILFTVISGVLRKAPVRETAPSA